MFWYVLYEQPDHMCFLLKLLEADDCGFINAVALEFPFTAAKRPKPAPAWPWGVQVGLEVLECPAQGPDP